MRVSIRQVCQIRFSNHDSGHLHLGSSNEEPKIDLPGTTLRDYKDGRSAGDHAYSAATHDFLNSTSLNSTPNF
jgi:hypothetical protein